MRRPAFISARRSGCGSRCEWPSAATSLYVWTSLIFSVLALGRLGVLSLARHSVRIRFLLSADDHGARATVWASPPCIAAVLDAFGGLRKLPHSCWVVCGLFFIQGGINAVSSFIPQIYLQVLASALFGSISYHVFNYCSGRLLLFLAAAGTRVSTCCIWRTSSPKRRSKTQFCRRRGNRVTG